MTAPLRIREVAVLHPFRATIDSAIAELRPDREIAVWTSEAELVSHLGTIEALVVSAPPRGVWADARALRLLHLAGVGAEGLLPAPDLPAHTRIACARGLFAAEVTEHVVAVMLAMVRRLPDLIAQQQRRAWRRAEVGTVAGKTLGILGFGAIGQRLAQVARALQMHVVATRLHPGAHPDASTIMGPAQTEALIALADVIVVALPHTPATVGLVGARALTHCRPGALLVDVSRGGIVDHAAVTDALADGRLAGAALDVFDTEPLPPTSPLWSTPGALVTPHCAGFGRRYAVRLLARVLENIGRLESRQPLLGEVDRRLGY